MKKIIWPAILALMLVMTTACGGKKQDDSAQDSIPYVLEENDSALLAAMDAAHAEFGPKDTAAAATAETSWQEGTFVEIQQGQDPARFVLKSAEEKMHSYYLAAELPDAQWKPYLEGGKQGTKVAVRWRQVSKTIKASGTAQLVEEIVEIQAR